MARGTIKEKLAERYQPDQPSLFDQDGEPAHPAVLALVVARRYEHTGVRLTEDEEKCQRLVELLQLKWGVARISKEMSIAKATVRAARRALAAQGKIGPYMQRVTEGLEDAIEAGIYAYRDAQENGKIAPAQIPVGVGILWDKRAAARGEATTIVGSARVESDRSPDAVNRAFAPLKICNSEAVKDAASLTLLPERAQIVGSGQRGATLDASVGRETAACMTGGLPPPSSPTDAPTPPMPATFLPPATRRPPAEPDGGGDSTGWPAANPNPIGLEN